MSNNEDKIAKLEIATREAEEQLNAAKLALEDSQQRVDTAKALLQQIDKEDQEKINVTDTALPELLEMHARAKENYESCEKRYETNKRYLKLYKEKLGGGRQEEEEVEKVEVGKT